MAVKTSKKVEQPPIPPIVWDVSDLAGVLKIPKATISYRIATSQYPEVETDLPYIRLGRSVRFIPEQIREYLKANQNREFRLKRKPKPDNGGDS